MSRLEQIKLKSAKDSAVKALFFKCDSLLKRLATDYPERETQTWSIQLEEAKAYSADPTAATPFISASLKEGETIRYYADIILRNNAAWSNYAGMVIKLRRIYEPLVQEATSVDEVNSLVREFKEFSLW